MKRLGVSGEIGAWGLGPGLEEKRTGGWTRGAAKPRDPKSRAGKSTWGGEVCRRTHARRLREGLSGSRAGSGALTQRRLEGVGGPQQRVPRQLVRLAQYRRHPQAEVQFEELPVALLDRRPPPPLTRRPVGTRGRGVEDDPRTSSRVRVEGAGDPGGGLPQVWCRASWCVWVPWDVPTASSTNRSSSGPRECSLSGRTIWSWDMEREDSEQSQH